MLALRCISSMIHYKNGDIKLLNRTFYLYNRINMSEFSKQLKQQHSFTNYAGGGWVQKPWDLSLSQAEKAGDIIPAILQPFELVIPRKYAPLVETFLRSKKIKLPGMT